MRHRSSFVSRHRSADVQWWLVRNCFDVEASTHDELRWKEVPAQSGGTLHRTSIRDSFSRSRTLAVSPRSPSLTLQHLRLIARRSNKQCQLALAYPPHHRRSYASCDRNCPPKPTSVNHHCGHATRTLSPTGSAAVPSSPPDAMTPADH